MTTATATTTAATAGATTTGTGATATTAGATGDEDLRAEVRAWLAATWDPTLTLREWWARLSASGWGYPTWPVEWFGKGLTGDKAAIVYEELDAAGVVPAPHGIGQTMGAPVLLQYGTDEQKRRLLPAIASGEEAWCQFFSEPNAGSDLASLQTRAVRDGDDWVVNGQKLWNGGTMHADRGVLVTRTDSDVPKHRGLSFFVIDLDQPGIEVRPIRQLNGEAEFNETFFTDARVPDANLIGGLGNGWAVALATLTNERSSYAAGSGYGPMAAPGEKGGQLDLPVTDVLADIARRRRAASFPLGDAAALVELAREHGRLADPVIRQRIARLYCTAEVARLNALRAKAAARAGRAPGAESSLGHLAGVLVARATRDLALEIVGAHGMLTGPGAPREGAVTFMALTSLVHGIQGGTEQIQRNIIGERVLGLPKEPQTDRDVPFRKLVVGTQQR